MLSLTTAAEALIPSGVPSGEVFAIGGVTAMIVVAILRVFYGEAPIHRSVKIIEAQREEAERELNVTKEEVLRWRTHSRHNEQASWRWEQRARIWHHRAIDLGWPDTDTVQSALQDDSNGS